MVLEINEAFTTCLLVTDENGNPASGKTISYRLFDEAMNVQESGSMNELGVYGIYYKSWTPDADGFWIFEAYYSGADFKFYDIKMYPVEKGEEHDLEHRIGNPLSDTLTSLTAKMGNLSVSLATILQVFTASETGNLGARFGFIQQHIAKGSGTPLPSNKSLYDVIALDRLDNPTYGLNALLTAINNIDFTSVLNAVNAVNVDLGDFSAQNNLKSLLQALGIPDVSGKSLYTCLITDRLDSATFGLAALNTDLDAILANTIQIADGSLPANPVAGSLARFIASGGTSLGTQLPASKSLYDVLGNPFSDTLTSLRDKLGNPASALGNLIRAAGATSGIPTVSYFTTNLSEATNDHYNGCIIIFTSGNLLGQTSVIVDYGGTNKDITVDPAFIEAPAASDSFAIVSLPFGGLRTGSKGLEQIYDLVDQIFTMKRIGDTLTTDGTEQNLWIVDSPDFPFRPTKLTIDLTNMVAGDSIQIKEYYRLKSGGSYIRKMTYSYIDNEDPPLKVIELEPNTYGVKITITRVLGTDRAYDYEVYFEER